MAAHLFLTLMVTGDRDFRRRGSREKAGELARELLDIYWWSVGKA